MKTNAQMGTIANIVCGIVGAFVGGFLANMLGLGGPRGAGFSVGQFVIGIIGACIVIAIYKAVTGAGNRVA
ncbi:MAG TPA: GlsB/YeaQ/YmgE family stress response membrane protein [Abditibacteriaceae bacterium]|nr:GlsB/YeaQ/YmgE family stress response membrane protein [Abditibacteriaceae bacterium]